MSEYGVGSQDSFFGSLSERLSQIQRALGHVGRAVHLDLAGVELQGSVLSEDDRQRYKEAGSRFLELAQMSSLIAESLGAKESTVVPSRATDETDTRLDMHKAVSVSSPCNDVPTITEEPMPDNIPSTPTSRLHRRAQDDEPLAATSKATERSKEMRTGRYYDRIISPDLTPIMELREGMEPILLRVTDDFTITIADRKVDVSGDKTYIFNVLMRMRDKPRSAKDIRDFGEFHSGNTGPSVNQAFNKAMNELVGDLNEAAKVEVIKKLGQRAGMKYAVNPCAQLADERNEKQGAFGAADSSEALKKN